MKNIAYKQMYESELTHGWYIGTRNHLIKTLKQKCATTSRILDAGAGTGGTIVLLKKAGFKNVIGIEKSDLAIKYSAKRGLKITKGDINKLPFKKDSFDVVVCLDVLYHQGVHPNLAIKEFQRVLKKGGLLYLQEPAYNFLKSRHDIAIATSRRFTKNQITKIVTMAGFKILKASYLNTLMFLPIAAKRLIDKFADKNDITSDVVSLSPFLNRLFSNSLKIESFLTSYLSLPFGLSIICLAKKN